MPWARKLVAAVLRAPFVVIFREQFLRRVFEHLDELVADDLSFRFGIGHAFEQLRGNARRRPRISV